MMGFVWIYLVVLVILVLASYGLGSFFVNAGKEAWRGIVFQRLLTGSLGLGVAYAIGRTGGQTYLMVMLLVFLIRFWQRGGVLRSWSWHLSAGIWPYLGLLGVFLFTFGLQLSKIIDFQGGVFGLHDDYYHYGRLAWLMSTTGREVALAGIEESTRAALAPYHFLEMWQSALLGHAFKLNMSLTLYLVVLPFYLGTGLLGFSSWVESSMGRFSWPAQMAVPILLWVSPLAMVDVSRLGSSWFVVSSMVQSIYELPKLSMVLCGLLYIAHGDFQPGMVMGFRVALAALVYPVILPALFLGYMFWLFWVRCSRKDRIQALFFPVLTALGLLLFYGWSFFRAAGSSGLWQEALLSFYGSRYGLVSVAYNGVFAAVSAASTLGVYLLALRYVLGPVQVQSVYYRPLMLALILVFAGVVCWSVGLLLPDSWQLHQNVFVVVVALVFAMGLARAWSGSVGWKKHMLLAGIVAVNLYVNLWNYSGEFSRGTKLEVSYYQLLAAEAEQLGPVKFGYFKSYDRYSPSSHRNPYIKPAGTNLSMFVNNYLPVCLSVFEIPVNNFPISHHMERSRVESTALFNHLRESYDVLDSEDRQRMILQFIEEQQINFIVYDSEILLPKGLKESARKHYDNENAGFGVLIF